MNLADRFMGLGVSSKRYTSEKGTFIFFVHAAVDREAA